MASAFEEEAGDEETPTGLGPGGSSLRQNSLPSLHQAPLHSGNVHEMWTLQVQAQPPVKRHLQVCGHCNSILFCFLCVKKIIDLPGGQINDTILFRSSQQLPRLDLVPLKGFFELTRHPSKSLDSPCALLP